MLENERRVEAKKLLFLWVEEVVAVVHIFDPDQVIVYSHRGLVGVWEGQAVVLMLRTLDRTSKP